MDANATSTGYAEYLQSPIHRKVDEIGPQLVDDMVSFDIAGDTDPGVDERIAELHRARFAGDEALAKLVGGLESFSGSGFGSSISPTIASFFEYDPVKRSLPNMIF